MAKNIPRVSKTRRISQLGHKYSNLPELVFLVMDIFPWLASLSDRGDTKDTEVEDQEFLRSTIVSGRGRRGLQCSECVSSFLDCLSWCLDVRSGFLDYLDILTFHLVAETVYRLSIQFVWLHRRSVLWSRRSAWLSVWLTSCLDSLYGCVVGLFHFIDIWTVCSPVVYILSTD